MGATGSTSAHFDDLLSASGPQLLDEVSTGTTSQYFLQSLVGESGGNDEETDYVACQEDRGEAATAADTMEMMLGAGLLEGKAKRTTQQRLVQELVTTLVGMPRFQSTLRGQIGLYARLNALVLDERAPADLAFFRTPVSVGADAMPVKQLILFTLASLLRASSGSDVRPCPPDVWPVAGVFVTRVVCDVSSVKCEV